MSLSIADIPLVTPLTADGKNFISVQWADWLVQGLIPRAQSSAQVLSGKVTKTAQSASISSTSIALPSIVAGLYRVSTYMRVTTVDAVSSSLTVTVGWTDGLVACTRSGVAMTGNTTGTNQGNVFTILSDASSPITYSTTYASNTPGQMVYKLTVLVELVSAT